MDDATKNIFLRKITSVSAGVASAFLTALILWPLVKLIFDKFFHLYLFADPPQDAWKDDLIVQINFMLWFFISSFSGGIICSLFSPGKEWFYVTASLLIVIAIITIITKASVFNEGMDSWLIMLMIPPGFFTGMLFAKKIKAGRAKKKLISPGTEIS
jgi:hypothetical protein